MISQEFDECQKNLTDFQKTLYAPGDPKLGVNHQQNKIYTPFYKSHSKISWSHHFSEKLPCSNIEIKSEMIFSANMKYHGLLYTTFDQELPSIRLKDGYTGRWVKNVGSKIINLGELRFNSQPLQTIDEMYNDYYIQCMADQSYDQDIGNIPSLQNWSQELPPYTTSFNLPWFYAERCSSYFPLLFCGYQDQLTHHYNLKRKISEIFEVKRNDEIVPFDSESIETVGSISGSSITSNLLLPIPEMWGEYMLKADYECEHNRCEAISQIGNTMIINDMISMDYEYQREKNFDDIKKNVHTFFWSAKHVNSPDYSYRGDNPIRSTSIHTGKLSIVDNIGSDKTSYKHPQKHFPRIPQDIGYNVWTCGMKAKDTYPIPGNTITSNGKVIINLKENSHDFIIKMRLIYHKKLTFVSFPDSEEKRKSEHCVITISD